MSYFSYDNNINGKKTKLATNTVVQNNAELSDRELFMRFELMSAAMQRAAESCRVFSNIQVRPSECDRASETLQELNGQTREICELWDIRARPHNQTLLALLYSFESLTKNTPNLILQLRLICLESTGKKTKLQSRVRAKIEEILEIRALLESEINEFRLSTAVNRAVPKSQRIH